MDQEEGDQSVESLKLSESEKEDGDEDLESREEAENEKEIKERAKEK